MNKTTYYTFRKQLNVKKLIELLKQFPEDALVYTQGNDPAGQYRFMLPKNQDRDINNKKIYGVIARSEVPQEFKSDKPEIVLDTIAVQEHESETVAHNAINQSE